MLSNALRSFGDTPKPLLFKVRVEGKRCPYPQSSHDLKADTVHQAELSVRRCENASDPRSMAGFVNPLDMQQGEGVLLESAHSLNAQPMLYQSEGLDQHVVAGSEVGLLCNQVAPELACSPVFSATNGTQNSS